MNRLFSRFFAPQQPKIPFDSELAGTELVLRMPKAADWTLWRFTRRISQNHLRPWEPRWPHNALSSGYYRSLLRKQRRDWQKGRGYAFSIFLRAAFPPLLVGGITLGDIRLAAAQKGTVGYWMGAPFAGCGYMTEALGLVCDFAFQRLDLQRIEASCLPTNEPSKAVLRNCGFEQEGYAKAYLQINGRREDHLLWAKNRKL